MIHSRFGTPVFKVISGNLETSEIDVIFYCGKDKDGNHKLETSKTYMFELRADDGIIEIEKAINGDYPITQEQCEQFYNQYCQ